MTSNFKTKKIPIPKRLSTILKNEREKRGLVPAQIEKATKIRKEYIIALEKGKFSVLPEEVYIRSFLRTLAKFFNLDPVILIERYREEIDPKKPGTRKPVNFRTGRLKEPLIIVTPRNLTIGLGILVGLFFLGYLWYEISGFAIAPKLIIDEPSQKELQINKDQLLIKGRTDSNAVLTINQEPVPVNQQGRFREKVQLQPGLNLLTLKAVTNGGKESSKEIKVIANQ